MFTYKVCVRISLEWRSKCYVSGECIVGAIDSFDFNIECDMSFARLSPVINTFEKVIPRSLIRSKNWNNFFFIPTNFLSLRMLTKMGVMNSAAEQMQTKKRFILSKSKDQMWEICWDTHLKLILIFIIFQCDNCIVLVRNTNNYTPEYNKTMNYRCEWFNIGRRHKLRKDHINA